MTDAERRAAADDEAGAGDAGGDAPSNGDRNPARLEPVWRRTRRTGTIRYHDIPLELAEGLRAILNRHELRTRTQIPASIAVTAALHGEGSTTISQALAAIIAQEMNAAVCWVDCGWLDRNAPAPEGNQPSLLDLLADPTRIVDAFVTSPDLPRLISLAPDPVPEAQRNLIVRSPEFERLLGILADEVDHVVFDVPPVLANASGLALLRRATSALLVARHRSTSIAQLQQVVDAIQPTPVLGVVLNQFRTRVPYRLGRILES